MSTIYIIGNGFDLDHKLNTDYLDFRDFIYTKILSEIGKDESLSDVLENINLYDLPMDTDRDGIQYLSPKAKLEIILKIVGQYTLSGWSNLEESLGLINFEQIVQKFPGDIYDNEGDIDYFKQDDFISNDSSNWLEGLKTLPEEFSEWIETIDIDKSIFNDQWNKVLNFFPIKNFISFNYTSTLEDVYDISNVFHVHGTSNDPNSIIFGHQNDTMPEHNFDTVGADDCIDSCFDFLKKAINIDGLEQYLRNSNQIDNLVFIGFSFGSSDYKYLEYFSDINKFPAIWWLYNYNDATAFKEKQLLESKFDINSNRIKFFKTENDLYC